VRAGDLIAALARRRPAAAMERLIVGRFREILPKFGPAGLVTAISHVKP
jgi:hypothetical protein